MPLNSARFELTQVRADILSLLGEHIPVQEGVPDDEDLSARGLTSMAIVALIYSIEDHFEVEIPESQMQLRNFLTVKGITEIVLANQR
ncbi:phosphopantetheine-binding protein (plasmid) [Streptomyces decoyicus]|uniref:phosphopantetheine-binding protein n=1 Tax=Streptomyces decoyicus TaxID=249567 RepID=UPI002E35DC82|nr:phosphopantetheine-binding protein [Streptomyces decoyicus]